VVKRDGATERYDRTKVFQSIARACAKRLISTAEIDAMVEAIDDAVARRAEDEIDSHVLGELVMEQLKAKDHVAYVRFASVYRNFQDLEEFYDELRDLSARRARAAQKEGQEELPLYDSP